MESMSNIRKMAEQYFEDAVELRRRIHQQPELSMEEKETSALVREKLREYGISIAELPLETGVIGVLAGERPGRTILLRADMDALPVEERSGLPFASEKKGVCHSCGHDIHTAALLLAARVLGGIKKDLAGTVLFLFQPAEEKLNGSQSVIESGLFEKYHPDFAVGLHCWPDLPAGTVGVRSGSFMASSDSVSLTVKGRGGHGAHPHKSVDPITAAAYILAELQTVVSRSVAPLEAAVLTMGRIEGGTAANVIPDTVTMEGTVRTVSRETRALMEEKIRQIACHGAEALGASCEVEYKRGVPAVICDPAVVERIRKAAAEELGSENVVTLETPSMGSEDFARYLELVPGAMFRIGTASEDPATRLPLHNGGIRFDERAVLAGAVTFGRLAAEYLR